MTVSYTVFGFVLILEPGDEVVRSLIQFAREYEIEAALITGAGAVSEVELGAGGTGGHEHRRRVRAPLEACSLTGAISLVDGEPFPHLHGTFARPDWSMLGGHVYEAVCSTRLEVAVQTASHARSLHTHTSPALHRTGTGT